MKHSSPVELIIPGRAAADWALHILRMACIAAIPLAASSTATSFRDTIPNSVHPSVRG
jgi:hypothetical protein